MLNDAQFLFSECLAQLLAEVKRRGEKCTVGDVWAVNFNPIMKWLDALFKVFDGDSPFHKMVIKIYDLLKKRLHSFNSKHYDKLAVDLNLFKPEVYHDPIIPELTGKKFVYCTETEGHAELGVFWKGLHPACEWGGDFPGDDIDGNHYQINRDKV